MRFQEYINEYKKPTRSKIISLDEIRKIIPQYSQAIKAAIDNKPTLIRETNVSHNNIYILDPKKGEKRVSKDISNYYTLIIDNSKRWAKYPKRSRSIICSTSRLSNLHGSDLFWIIPKNGAKIGECSSDDIWFSFNNVAHSMEYFNNSLEKILHLPKFSDEEIKNFKTPIKISSKESFDRNITEFKKAYKNFDKWFNNKTMLSSIKIKNIFNTPWLDRWDDESIFDYMNRLLDPKTNGFKLKSIDNLSSRKEAWTDSTSLIVPDGKVEDIINIYKEI